jgi:hypothetical protein
MTTIFDVARAAGVSTATVSSVLNKNPQVDPRLAATVLQAIKDLGYRRSVSPSFGAVAAAWSYFRRLGLEEHFSSLGDGRRSRVLSDTVFAMVANRLTGPFSERRTIKEWLASVALPVGVVTPSLDQCYRVIDALAENKEATEALLYSELCNLANLDLRLVCYDLTSSYFETVAVRGRHGTRHRERETDQSRPAVPVDDAAAGPRFVERGPGAAHLRRRQTDQSREPAQCPPRRGAQSPRRRHLNLVQGRNRLTRTFSSRVGERLSSVAPST